MPSVAFRVLDAPRLKDDYYCSVLAYCQTYETLAVALAHRVYLWTEQYGVQYPPLLPSKSTNYVSALTFSSDASGRAILAIARNSGHVSLWSLFEAQIRFELRHPWAACAVGFRPNVTMRQSTVSFTMTSCEDLLVGDDSGCLYYYSVEWPANRHGAVTLLLKLDAHAQNVCGIAWSPDGLCFASGGNDNMALLFDADELLGKVSTAKREQSEGHPVSPSITRPNLSTSHASTWCVSTPLRAYIAGEHASAPGFRMGQIPSGLPTPRPSPSPRHEQRGRSALRSDLMDLQQHFEPTVVREVTNPDIKGQSRMHKYAFFHSAAVKAIAFAPWQPTLLATSGGSNDRQIHFHHTGSGTTLAVINVFAQVTSLAWSTTRREIVATFGYAQPEHDVRIAVFAWPSCECVVNIPWERKANGEIGRALWAIPYPGGPNDALPDRAAGTNAGFEAWEAMQARHFRTRNEGQPRTEAENLEGLGSLSLGTGIRRGRRFVRNRTPRHCIVSRGEGETWASRTEDEGSLIIACCDQTVKFFEIWAGKSKGQSKGIGAKAGVLGGSKVLEG